MHVKVNAFSMIRSILGQNSMQLDLPEGATVRDAIERIIEQGGPKARNMILSPDGKSLKISVIVNGASVGMDAPLSDGDEMNLMVTIGGGTFLS